MKTKEMGLATITLILITIGALVLSGCSKTTDTPASSPDPVYSIPVVEFTGFGDETIDLTGVTDIPVYHELVVIVTGDYDSCQWFLNGEDTGIADTTYTFSSSYLTGTYNLTAVVSLDSVPYSKTVTFRVTQ